MRKIVKHLRLDGLISLYHDRKKPRYMNKVCWARRYTWNHFLKYITDIRNWILGACENSLRVREWSLSQDICSYLDFDSTSIHFHSIPFWLVWVNWVSSVYCILTNDLWLYRLRKWQENIGKSPFLLEQHLEKGANFTFRCKNLRHRNKRIFCKVPIISYFVVFLFT